MTIPRKLLMVKKVIPDEGFVVMIEVDDRTRSIQLSETAGNVLMLKLQEVIVEFARRNGLVKAKP